MLDVIQERLSSISESELIGIIISVIAIIQSFKKVFKLTNTKHIYILTIIVSFGAYLWLLFKGNIVIDLVALFIVIIGGATGIYNFIPVDHLINNEKMASESEID